ncbi:hypothetical protein GCM10022222_01210 [Amycolatopsis ultiminotia]|uniref:Uncharacterized protein n=1 Tax=Amycolatopsis ultiminotia TaxID=543629 RepID=A0ABP6UYZ4_9PSEU
MIVRITADGQVDLCEPLDFTSFSVQAPWETDPADVGRALVANGWGEVEGDHAWILSDAVRAAASDEVDPGWAEKYEAMLRYATARGWWRERDRAIRAHLAFA